MKTLLSLAAVKLGHEPGVQDEKEEVPLSDELPVRRTARRIAKWVEGSGVVGLPLIRLTYAGVCPCSPPFPFSDGSS